MTVIAIYFPDDPLETSPQEAPIHGASVHFPDDAEPGPTVVPARIAIYFPDET